MKKTLLILTCLLQLLIAVKPVVAQQKSALVKPKATLAPKPVTAVKATTVAKTAVAVKIPVLNKLDPFTKTPDDLVQFLNDEFKKLNLTLKDIDETTIHQYDGTKQLEGVFSTSRELMFTNDVLSTITADANDKVTELQVELAATDTVRYKAIKNMLAFAAWPVVFSSDVADTYKNGNTIAYAGTQYLFGDSRAIEDSYYFLSVKTTTPYTYQPKAQVVFNGKALTINDNAEDVGYSIVKIIEGLGFDLLYKKAEEPAIIDNKLHAYSTRYQFKNAVSADIETTPFRKFKLIDIDADDPISFLKIKKALGVNGWKMVSSDAEAKAEFYEYNNIKCTVYGDTKSITFTVSPERSDIVSWIQDSDIPSFDDLMDLYLSGTRVQVMAAVSKRYVNEVLVKENSEPLTFEPNKKHDPNREYFLIRTDESKVPGEVEFYFGEGKPTFVMVSVKSDDAAYLTRISEECKTGKYKDKYSCSWFATRKGIWIAQR